ncbi:MAG: PDZ domain-containing protein [Dermatophilaceae bacterium]|nr:PDZ domain-containing protein [Dermatophilaceae bacterium]
MGRHAVKSRRDERAVASREPDTSLSRRSSVWLIAIFLGIVLGAVMGVVHLPYAILQPGPVTNTLGNGPEGKPLITVTGKASYPTTGALDFTTVAVLGGPRNPVNGWNWFGAQFDKTATVVPEEELFPKGVTSKEVDHENAAEMANSQQEAIAVALRALGQTVPEVVSIGELTKDSPAKGVLVPGDIVASIDGKAVSTPDAIRAAVRTHKPGERVKFTVRRGGTEKVLTVRTTDAAGKAVVGILLRTEFVFPTKVSINAGDVGGPSAGTMFSLAVYDKLTPGSLTGGVKIAGTGTIDSVGNVGPIGGIRQKLVGAKQGSAAWFLAPAANCNEVVGHVPDGLKVVKVATFTQARDAVQAIAAKRTTSLPTCK